MAFGRMVGAGRGEKTKKFLQETKCGNGLGPLRSALGAGKRFQRSSTMVWDESEAWGSMYPIHPHTQFQVPKEPHSKPQT